MLPGPDPRWKRTRANSAGSTMKHGSVRRISSSEVPAFHGTGKTLALADAGNVHIFAGLEVVHQNPVTGLGFIGGVFEANFLKTAHRRHICLLKMPCHRLGNALWLDEFHQ